MMGYGRVEELEGDGKCIRFAKEVICSRCVLVDEAYGLKIWAAEFIDPMTQETAVVLPKVYMEYQKGQMYTVLISEMGRK